MSPLNVFAQNQNQLNVAVEVDPDGLDPQRTTAASTFRITNNIYDTLVRVDSQGGYVPCLAESWEISDDGMEITFKLAEGIKFHNDNPFNAEAVKASFDRLKEEGSPRAGDYKNISNIEVVSDNEIKFVTDTLDVELLSKFAYQWAAIVDASIGDDLKTNPVGTGSYKLVEWVPQDHLTLTAYDGAVMKPSIADVQVKTIPDAQSLILALQSGEIDMASIGGDQVDLLSGNESIEIIETQSNGLEILALNTENEYLSNQDVRLAMNMAVDKDALIDAVSYGYGEKIGSHYPPILQKEYVDLSEKVPYDPEGAKELLAKAGYPDGFSISMDLPKDYPNYVDGGQIIAQNLEAIGITVEINIVEWPYWLETVYADRQFDTTYMGHTGRLDAYQWLARYHSESAENYMNYSNERVDEILETAPQTTDEEERTEMYKELQEILSEELPAIYVESPLGLMAINSKVKGYQTYPISVYQFADLSFEG